MKETPKTREVGKFSYLSLNGPFPDMQVLFERVIGQNFQGGDLGLVLFFPRPSPDLLSSLPNPKLRR